MNIRNKLIIPSVVGMAAFTGMAGASLISAAGASADTTTTTASTSQTSTTAPTTQPDPPQGGHVGANGTKEVLLTGDTATKATAAAQAAVSSGTVQRVENDAEGAVYEAHVLKADGTHVSVKMDANFKVTGIEDGPSGPEKASSATNN